MLCIRRQLLTVSLGTASLFATERVHAAAPMVSTPAESGQLGLSVGFDAARKLRAAACPSAPCDLARGLGLDLPSELASKAELTPFAIGAGRHAVHVRSPDPAHDRVWEAVVTAPASGAAAPRVLFQGFTGLVEGEYGLRHGPMVVVSEAEPDATRRVVIGEQREDVTLCGRPTVLAPQMLTPTDLELHPAKVQRLTAGERARAGRIVARRISEPSTPAPRLLRAVAASSAIGSPQAVTDGNLESSWAENRGGDGRGEFVVAQTSHELKLKSFEIVVRPPQADSRHGVAPREFWLVTSNSLWLVSLPEDAWRTAGARYEIALPTPLVTDCVALALESAYGQDRDAQVTIAEFVARSELDATTPAGLAAALAGGGPRAEAAAAALRSLGEPGTTAVMAEFSKLDEPGRALALSVLDQAPCAVSAPAYVAALLGSAPGQRHHARTRLGRCGDDAGPALEAALAAATPRQRALLGDELALAAPSRAVALLVHRLGRAGADERRGLRIALARATRATRARPSVLAALANPSLDTVALLDLLRALGPRIAAFLPQAERAFLRLAQPTASFRTRYLLLEPAAHLAPKSAETRAYLVQALRSDQRAEVRAQAARAMGNPPLLGPDLKHALSDPAVRVREAALGSLASTGGGFAQNEILERLAHDAWPLVRQVAALALAEQGASAHTDRALVAALSDDSATVRAAAITALGQRGARVAGPELRQLLVDNEEPMAVRIAAATAVGRLCLHEAADDLTRYARLLVDPTAGETRLLGPTALAALGRIHPSDLDRRVAPLLDPRAPPGARAAARAALSRPSPCRGR